MKNKIFKKVLWTGVAFFTLTGFTACTGQGTTSQSVAQESTREESEQSSVGQESTQGEADPQTSIEAGEKLELEQLPVIDGATANAPFYQAAVARMCDVDMDTAVQNTLCSTTKIAYENLISGLADMIIVSYPSKEQEEEALEAGVEFEYHQILTGAFVFFVNKDNPVDHLTIEQLQGIYRGEITNWKEVGGNDEEIIAFQREEGTGSQNGLYRYLLPKEEVMKSPSEYYYSSMEGIVEAFGNAKYDNSGNAIGYSYYYYVANMECNDQIKLITLEGVQPNNETIGNGTYPFCNPTLAVIRKGTESTAPVYRVIDWMKSSEGAELAEELGYVANRTGGNMAR